MSHRGTAILDIISPCVTFNDHVGSTKSYAYVKDHDFILNAPDFIRGSEEIVVDYEPGTVQDIELEDGSHVLLRKLAREYDATNRIGALQTIHQARSDGELVTGLLFIDPAVPDLCEREKLVATPLKDLKEDDLRISRDEWTRLFA